MSMKNVFENDFEAWLWEVYVEECDGQSNCNEEEFGQWLMSLVSDDWVKLGQEYADDKRKVVTAGDYLDSVEAAKEFNFGDERGKI